MSKPAPALVKLVLLVPHLGGGGAERVINLLANHLDRHQFNIHLVLVIDDAPGACPLEPWVTVHRLHARRVRYAAPGLLRLLWTLRPSVALSGLAHLNFLLLLLKPLLPASLQLLLRQNSTASATSGRLSRRLYRHLYPKAAAIICQSKAMANDLTHHFGISPEKVVTLANPLVPAVKVKGTKPPDRQGYPRLLCVARLALEKGLDLLLRALPEIHREFPGAVLEILGIGPEELALQRLTRELGLGSHVRFRGYSDPLPFFPDTTLFVSPSRLEGLPNALLEAASEGLPIVATRSYGGIDELLANAPGTWICPQISAEAIARTIVTALRSLRDETAPNPRFQHAFTAPFKMKSAIRGYEELLLRVARMGHP